MHGWGHVCVQCLHAGAVHRLARDADTMAGPYTCRSRGCHCSIDDRDSGVLVPLDRTDFLALFPTWPAPLHAMLDEGDPMAHPPMNPNLSIRVVDGRAYLAVLGGDAVTELELSRDDLSALAGEAVRKAMVLALGG